MDIEIRGTVCDGQGQARGFSQLDWVRRQFRSKFGFDPYPGTLNLRVENTMALAPLRAAGGIPIQPGSTDACPAKAFRVRVGRGIDAAWIVPQVAGYPEDVIELMAPVSLRETLRLKTGDTVVVRILEPNAGSDTDGQ